mgnify:CR=1 FL=1
MIWKTSRSSKSTTLLNPLLIEYMVDPELQKGLKEELGIVLKEINKFIIR